MKKIILLLFIFSFYKSSAQHAFSKIYNFSPLAFTNFSSNYSTYADSNYFFGAGITFTSSDQASYLACFNYSGDLVWNTLLPYWLYGTSVLQKMSDTMYVLSGDFIDTTIGSDTESVLQPYLLFFSASGDSLRYLKFEDSFLSRYVYSEAIDAAKNIYLAGSVDLYKIVDSAYKIDSIGLWVAKFDSTGNMLWQKSFYSLGDDPFKIIVSHDGKSLFVTESYMVDTATGTSLYDCHLTKIDTAGNLIWDKTFEKWDVQGLDITATNDGNYAFAGSAPDEWNSASTESIHYGKINDNGDTLWTKIFKSTRIKVNDLVASRVLETHDKRLMILADKYLSWNSPSILTTDSTGNVLSFREYKYVDSSLTLGQALTSISETPSKNILLAGMVSGDTIPGITTADYGGFVSWYILTDSFGCIVGGCQSGDSVWQTTTVPNVAYNSNSINVYPNPASDILNIGYNNLTDGQLIISDITGRKLIIRYLNGSNGIERIDVHQLPMGIYIYSITDEMGAKFQGKVIID